MKPEYHKQIEQLYLDMFDMLLSYAQCSFEEASLAEEAVQETFRVACQKPESLCESVNPKGWLVNTLKFTIRKMKRSREQDRQLLSACLAGEAERAGLLDNKLFFHVMYENVSELEEFKLIEEKAIDGRSILEMANARGISVCACKKRVQRAREKLKKKIKKDVTK